MSLQSEALHPSVLPVGHTDLPPVLRQREAVGDVEAVGALGHCEGPGSLPPLEQFLHQVFPVSVHTHPVLDHPTIAVAVTHKEAVGVLGNCHGSGFTVVMVVRAGDEPLPQHDQWLVVPAVRGEFVYLMESNVRHPDVVFAVHGDHVGQEENISAPGVDNVTRGVDCEHCVHWYRGILVHTVGVVPGKTIYIRTVISFTFLPFESLRIPSPVASVEDDGVAIDINGHSRYLSQSALRFFARPTIDH